MAEEVVLQQPPKKFSFFMIIGVIVFLYFFLIPFTVENIDSFVIWRNTGDIKPLLDSTIGMVFAHDFLMEKSIIMLQNPILFKEYADYLKIKIFQSFFILFIIIWFIMWLLAKIFRGGVYHFVWLVVAMMLVFILELVYIRTLHKIPVGDYIPFTGIWHFFYFLAQNPQFIANVGNQSLSNTFGNFSI